MKRWALLLMAVGCGSSDLDVRFRINDVDLATAIDRYSVEVYQPTAERYGCADLAFGTVQAMPIFEAQLEESVPEVGQVPIEGTKLFVVRGHGDAGALVVGCQAIGTIEGHATIDIIAEPVTRAVIDGSSDGLIGGDREVNRSQFDRWAVSVEDQLGRAQTNIDVRWQAFGSGLTEALRGDATQETDGTFVVLPSEPRPGPLRVSVRSRWGVQGSSATVMVPPEVTSTVLDGPGEDFQIVQSTSMRPKILTTAQLSDSEMEVVQYDLDGGAIRRRGEVIKGAWRLGRTSASRFLLSDVAVRHLSESTDGETTIGPEEPFRSGAGTAPTGMLDLSACDGRDPLVLVRFGENSELFDGALVSTQEPGNRFAAASGCIEAQDGPPLRALWTPPLSGFELQVRTPNGLLLVSIDDRVVSLTFGGQWGGRPLALTTSVSGSDTEIALNTVGMVQGEIALIRERAEPLAGPAHVLDVGDIDNNGVLDIAAVTRIDGTQYAVYLVAVGTNESAAAGMLLPVGFVDPWIAVADFDGDKIDDVAIGDRRAEAGGEGRPLVIYRLGRRRG